MINYFEPFQIMLKHDLKKLSPETRQKTIEFLLDAMYPGWDKTIKRKSKKK